LADFSGQVFAGADLCEAADLQDLADLLLLFVLGGELHTG